MKHGSICFHFWDVRRLCFDRFHCHLKLSVCPNLWFGSQRLRRVRLVLKDCPLLSFWKLTRGHSTSLGLCPTKLPMMWDVGADHSDVPVLVWALVHTVLPLFFSILCFRQPQEVNHRFPISHHGLLVNMEGPPTMTILTMLVFEVGRWIFRRWRWFDTSDGSSEQVKRGMSDGSSDDICNTIRRLLHELAGNVLS